MTITIEIPNGPTLEFPDDTPPEVIRRQTLRAAGGQVPPPIDPAGEVPGIPEPVGLGDVPGLIPRGVSPGELLPQTTPGFPIAPGILPPAAARDPDFERRLRGSAQDLQEGLRTNIPKAVRPGMVMAGETIGGEVGLITGGAPGLLAGTALGSAGASFAFDSLNDAMEFFGEEPFPGGTPRGEGVPQTMGARILRAGEEAKTGVAFGAAGATVFPITRMAAPALGKILGVRGDPARALATRAESLGIDLGAIEVGQGVGGLLSRGFGKVLGIFPFSSGPLRTFRSAKETQLRSRVDFILDEIAPTASTAELLGINIAKATRNTKTGFDIVAAQMYDPVRQIMQNIRSGSGELIPFIRMGQTKDSVAKHLKAARLRDTPQQRVPGEEQEFIDAPGDKLREFLETHENIADDMTYDQWSGFQEKLNTLADSAEGVSGNDMRRIAEIKRGVEFDLNAHSITAEEVMSRNINDPEVMALNLQKIAQGKKLKDDADAFFQAGIVHFQTPTAQRIARQNKNIFKPGPDAPGTLNEDELLKPTFQADSPIALRNMRTLVGDDVFRSAARAHIDDSVEKAIKTELRAGKPVEVLSLDDLATNLGLSKGLKDRRAALTEMLKGSGTSVDDLEDLITSARIMKIQDPSQFVTRRVTLGGAAALGAAAGLGGAALKSGNVTIADALIITFLSRKAAQIVADPKALKVLQNSLDPTLDEVSRRAMLLRLVKAVSQTPEGQEQTKPLREDIKTRLRNIPTNLPALDKALQ